MMEIFFPFLMFSFVCGMINYFVYRDHILFMLLGLEFMMLIVFMFFSVIVSLTAEDYYIPLYYLTISVCDGGLGLSLLVSLIRSHGEDKLSLMSLNYS